MAEKKSRKSAGGRPFKPGQSGNPSGKPPGTPNRKTLEWEAFGRAIIEGNLDWMQKRINELKEGEPDAAFDRLVEFMEYFKPKLSRTELKNPDGESLRITFGGDA